MVERKPDAYKNANSSSMKIFNNENNLEIKYCDILEHRQSNFNAIVLVIHQILVALLISIKSKLNIK